MKSRPQFTDPIQAARVSTFMEDATMGRWKMVHFTITDREHRLMLARAVAEGGIHRDERIRRTIQPGTYMTLQRKATPQELEDIRRGDIVDATAPDDATYIPVMSDTHSEIEEHLEAIKEATGRVLITGLGLGCIVSSLLTKPDVEHITVVEVDKDVIALTGPYYEDEPRVTIINADALKLATKWASESPFMPETEPRFDFAWHDIWSHISDRNLDDDDIAEHGISYFTMFEAWNFCCEMQSAWAYPQALEMRALRDREKEEADIWAREFIAADDDRRVVMLVEHMVRQQLSLRYSDPVPQDVYDFFNEHFDGEADARRMLAERPMAEDFQKIVDSAEEPDSPMDRPNEVEGANVAL